MGLNPTLQEQETKWKDNSTIGVEGAEVTRTQAHTQGDEVGHSVYVKPDTLDRDILADVATTQTGDVCIPEAGSRVIIGYRVNERPIVLGQRYQIDDTIPDFEPGERVIGHPLSDSHIRLAKDGSITIKGDGGNTIELASDGSVTINGGSTKAIKNVEAGGTNSEGGITSLDITRSSDVYIP
jgi:hypothetical protein